MYLWKNIIGLMNIDAHSVMHSTENVIYVIIVVGIVVYCIDQPYVDIIVSIITSKSQRMQDIERKQK